MERKSKKTLKSLKPKLATTTSRKARGRLLKSIDSTPSGKTLIGGRDGRSVTHRRHSSPNTVT